MLPFILAIFPFFYFVLIASITPGPNNIMLTASGMNFGYLKTVPHIVGICTGFLVLLILCSLGIGAIYKAFPIAQTALKFIGSGYLLYLAYRILTSGAVGLKKQVQHTVKPMTFWEAFGFQFINPKGVIFGMTALTILPADFNMLERCIAIIVAVAITAPISTHTWAIMGQLIAKLFRDDKMRHIINGGLALLLIATIPMMFS